ncbi:sterol 3-beta-glucosyltransferase UGT80B1 [Amborella trichopoda]|nr:sterol 3-beta-glucosyltransferase UGT80B1 [Amborella trichopoda]XP_020527403.1 sterol 3-beta-glucosyltransferase UGT80B1 [Amborella trichopoda]XP_020527405.1 sterol 3-beta-glucosyltransferase UGT80B1 [Amborella trichopoda]XP_020527406.1 sterol 3-beta-glucosyltransferase UGT80B1 [Amborella trichopoda]XP_020527407.1 sterol 3-beta-glucosyltransferase UGT80B1 [Amborella trichopoda]|eukprot:XP_011625938.1 sterol 3-beta-glucosyltransferase UGT80B1 [Amborella trichopoda]
MNSLKKESDNVEANRLPGHSPLGNSVLQLSSMEGVPIATSSPRALEHCKTAPAGTNISQNLLIENSHMALSRSKTEKKDIQKHDLKLDRLSDREKKKIIENLARVQDNGIVEVDVALSAPVASELLELDVVDAVHGDVAELIECSKSVPKLKVAMLVVGTRGDVQPFVAIAKRLQEFGHHVRLATHANFRSFVRAANVEFYPLGGDPRILAGYMARNKGFLPSGPAEISIQRKQLKVIIDSLLPACTEPDMESGVPFQAQAIIANPPAYGHAHVAEALGVPLHIFFTMPWTPTSVFPHPLARVSQSAGYRLSYLVVDLLIWWGIRGFVNDFRRRKLKLPPIAYFSTYHGSISHLPTGYMWSPNLVPKPKDWGLLVDVVGFCFLNLGTKYQPEKEFLEWLQAGMKPIYVGFGSMPLEDATKTTSIIIEALKDTGQRGIIGKGWGDLGNLIEVPESVFLLKDCPHDWLFPLCSAVVHHGGAGTTATGLRAGCPTTIIPFFGDQFFWGDRVHEKGVGPAPIPIYELSVERLANAIRFMLDPEVKLKAMELAKEIENEDGVAAAVDAFHRHLPEELPLPSPPTEEPPNPFDWIFQALHKWCCLPCGV